MTKKGTDGSDEEAPSVVSSVFHSELPEIAIGKDDSSVNTSSDTSKENGNRDDGSGSGDHKAELETDDDKSNINNNENHDEDDDAPWSERIYEVFVVFWPLGFVAFGGPQAHVAILHDRLVVREKWLDEDSFIELFAIGQGLPGPTSTQLVVSTALSRAGPVGGLLAFFLWNLPGLVVLTTCGVLIADFVDENNSPFYLVGLPPAAICLVFKAAYGFGLKLDTLGVCVALISALGAIWINGDKHVDPDASQFVFPILLVCGGIASYLDSRRTKPLGNYDAPQSGGWDATSDRTLKRIGIPLWVGGCIGMVWAILLIVISILGSDKEERINKREDMSSSDEYFEIFSVMYRIGSLIYGGGQVVLPMLHDEVVPYWMTTNEFYQGLALSQSMPGPLFNFSSYLGAVWKGIPGALLAYLGLFGPGIILIFAVVPFWARMRRWFWFRSTLRGINAAAIGFVMAACVIMWEDVIKTTADAMVFVVSLTLAVYFNIGAPYVVLSGGVLGAILFKDALSLGQKSFCDDDL